MAQPTNTRCRCATPLFFHGFNRTTSWSEKLCPLSVRSSFKPMSQMGQTRTLRLSGRMSVLPPRTDIERPLRHVGSCQLRTSSKLPQGLQDAIFASRFMAETYIGRWTMRAFLAQAGSRPMSLTSSWRCGSECPRKNRSISLEASGPRGSV